MKTFLIVLTFLLIIGIVFYWGIRKITHLLEDGFDIEFDEQDKHWL